MFRTYCFVLSGTALLLGQYGFASVLPICITSQPDSQTISANIPDLSVTSPITWTVDDMQTDNTGAKTTFVIEPWDQSSYTLSAIDATGAKICDAQIQAHAMPIDLLSYIDPYTESVRVSSSVTEPTKVMGFGLSGGQRKITALPQPATQTQGGSISGRVLGSAGIPVQDANVEITNLETGVIRQSKTSSEGSYELKGLDAGKYNVAITQPGFAVWKQSDVLVASTSLPKATVVPVKVYYATERELLAPSPIVDYGQKRNSNDSLSYGAAIVAVPQKHSHSILGNPNYWSYNPKEYSVSFSPVMQKSTFLNEVALQAAKNTNRKSLLVFIHGFNNSFREDIYKTAQLSYDTQFLGTPVMFDWPATTPKVDLVGGYITDLSQVIGSISHLEDFLEVLATSSGGATINVVAHSMGNRLLLEALDRMRADHRLPQLGQVILAAPDIDAGRFKTIIDPLLASHMISRVTLYGSHKDWAMALSKRAHQGQSAIGSMPPVPNVGGIDTIDVSDLPMNVIGHDYFITTRPVLDDIGVLLDSGSAPPRAGLSSVTQGQLTYWRLTGLTVH